MMQPFHPVFRHLWYLATIVMVSLVVLGFAYEKLNSNMAGLAVLGFSASIVHAAAWWFTLGVTSPLRKFGACMLLFAGAMISSTVGRFAFLSVGQQPFQPLLENAQFIAGVVPVWWLSLAIVNGIAKEALRWRLNYKETLISPRTSLMDMFQLTAILGIVLAFCSPFISSLIETEYVSMLLVSICVHAFMVVPLSMLILSNQRRAPIRAASFAVVFIGLCGLLVLVFSRFLGYEFESVSDVAVGFSAFIVPYILMLFWARDEELRLSSGWYKDPP